MNVKSLSSGKWLLRWVNGNDVGISIVDNFIISVLFIILLPTLISAQELKFPQRSSLPYWIGTALKQLDSPDLYEFSSRLNPFYLHGDFDGDSEQDVAIWIRNREASKSGIVIIHRNTGKVHLIGAGNPIVNGAGEVLWAKSKSGDSLDFIDAWLVYEKGRVAQGAGEAGPPPTLKGDALLLMKTESASGLIYWTGKNYAWYQQDD
jgi:hypothetical protein